MLAAGANALNPPDPEYTPNSLPLETKAGGGLVGVVENADTGVVPNEDSPNTEAPSWDGAPEAGVGVADDDGDAVFLLVPKALTVGGLGFANAEVPNVLLPNVKEPNTDIALRFANTPKPLEGATILVFLNGEEAGVVDAAIFPNGLDWTCADPCVGEPSASSASGDILVSSSIWSYLRPELRGLPPRLESGGLSDASRGYRFRD